jgi:hypothetical protein
MVAVREIRRLRATFYRIFAAGRGADAVVPHSLVIRATKFPAFLKDISYTNGHKE